MKPATKTQLPSPDAQPHKPLVVALAEDFADACIKAQYVTTSHPTHAALVQEAARLTTAARQSCGDPSVPASARVDLCITQDDVSTLIGHAIGLKMEGKEDMPAYFFQLAERIAMARGDEASAEQVRAVALKEASISRPTAVEGAWGETIPTEIPLRAVQVAPGAYAWQQPGTRVMCFGAGVHPKESGERAMRQSSEDSKLKD